MRRMSALMVKWMVSLLPVVWRMMSLLKVSDFLPKLTVFQQTDYLGNFPEYLKVLSTALYLIYFFCLLFQNLKRRKGVLHLSFRRSPRNRDRVRNSPRSWWTRTTSRSRCTTLPIVGKS